MYRYNQYIEISVDTSIQILPRSSWSISDNMRTMQFHLVSFINTCENSINDIHNTKILKCWWTMDLNNYCKHLLFALIDTYSSRNVAFWSEKQISLWLIDRQTCMSTLCFSERLVSQPAGNVYNARVPSYEQKKAYFGLPCTFDLSLLNWSTFNS
jgi:hypothetical protein